MSDPVCYLRGTRIATPAGEIAVERLRIGDKVLTKFGGARKIRWIGMQKYSRRFIANNRDQIPVHIEAGALGEGLPKRDLFVSPGHSMLIGAQLVLARHLVNGITITQHWAPDELHYYQLEFKAHDCVLAEGAWSESYADAAGLRNKFHNTAEFYRLYPRHRAPSTPILCAPRPLAGPALERLLRPIVAQAAACEAPGGLRGWVDTLDANGLAGWARDADNTELPVLLDFVLHGRVVHQMLACDPRPDLAAPKAGPARCGFKAVFARPLTGFELRTLIVRRAADGAELPRAQPRAAPRQIA